MALGKLFLTSIASNVITLDELEWITKNQINFSKCELETALKLGKMLDCGQIHLACRI